jgi:hypothetical protein
VKFRLGCELAYKVVAKTVFIFNVEVALLQRHSDLVDQLIFNPNVERRSYTVPDLKNRYTQVVAQVGNFSLSYTAEVDLNIYRADPETVHEMQVRDLHSTFFLIFCRAGSCRQTSWRSTRCASSPGFLTVTFASV